MGANSQLVANHILGDVYRHMLAAVMHGEVWPTKSGKMVEERLQVFKTRFSPEATHFLNTLQQSRLDERSFLMLLPMFLLLSYFARLTNQLVRALVMFAGLEAHGGLAPGSHGVGMTPRRAALAAAVRMVTGVHDRTADGGTPAHMTLTASFADVHVLVVQVADLADGGDAVPGTAITEDDEQVAVLRRAVG